jgi:hypothetical protein
LRVSRYDGRWIKNLDGPLDLIRAKQLLRSRGVRVPGYLKWRIGKRTEGVYVEAGLKGADAFYFRSMVSFGILDVPVSWGDLLARGRMPVVVREDVLDSDEHTLYVFAHEIHEIEALRRSFEEEGGGLSLRKIINLIDPEHDGVLHEEAVRYADNLVSNLRRERGLES